MSLLAPSPFGWLLVRRALASFGVLSVVALALAAASDEPDSSWAMRAARWAAFAPALLGIACAVTLRQSESRGELRALRAIGVSQVHLGILLSFAGAVVALGSTIVLWTSLGDVSALFPTVTPADPWQPSQAGFDNLGLGVHVASPVDIRFIPAQEVVQARLAASRWAAWLLAVPAALVIPIWVAVPSSTFGRGALVFVVVIGSLVLFHALAVGRVPVAWMLLPALALTLQSAIGAWKEYR
jgi:hypothetical protein